MLIEMKEIKTKTYPLDQGFFLDVTTTCKQYDAWLYHKNYGIKEHIYGMNKCDIEYDNFLDLIESTIAEDIKFFVDDYFDFTERKEYHARENNIN